MCFGGRPGGRGGGGRGARGAGNFWLALDEDGDAVLYSSSASAIPSAAQAGAPFATSGAAVVWRAGLRFPASCGAGSECRAGAFLALNEDGSMELRRRLKPAMAAYVTYGAPAAQRLRQCLWHNNFAAEATAAGGVVVPPRPQPDGGGGRNFAAGNCTVPPVLLLATFPNSGTSFTMIATQEATGHAVYTAFDFQAAAIGGSTGVDAAGIPDLCGFSACKELGMCPVTPSHKAQIPPPPAGRGALVKSHVMGYGTGAFCGVDGIDRYREALGLGAGGVPLERFGVLRLFRNPFDNMVARFHLLANAGMVAEDAGAGETHGRAGFLSNGGRLPKRDIYSYLYWHLNANVVFKELGLPIGLLTYENIYEDTVGYLRAVVSMLGWKEGEVPNSRLEAVAQKVMGREFAYLRSGEPVPAYIDEYYDADTVRFIADVMHEVFDRTDCLQTPNYSEPPVPRPVFLTAEQIREREQERERERERQRQQEGQREQEPEWDPRLEMQQDPERRAQGWQREWDADRVPARRHHLHRGKRRGAW